MVVWYLANTGTGTEKTESSSSSVSCLVWRISTTPPLFRQETHLGEDQEEHDKGDGVEEGVEAERAGSGEGSEETREGEGEDGGEEVGDCDSPCDTLFTLSKREDLSGVHVAVRSAYSHGREVNSLRDRTLSERVEGGEDVDEKSDEGGTEAGILDKEAHAAGEQGPAHVG